MKLSLRNKYGVLAVGIFMVIWLLLSQLIANRILLIACLFSILIFAAWSALNDIAMPVLLFFLPWSRLMKLGPGRTSFYTLALLVVLMVYLLVKHRNISTRHLVIAAFLMALTFIAKIGAGYSINNSYLLFFFFLMFSSLLSTESDEKYDFYFLTIFFVLGIVIAALSAKRMLVFPSISRFISVDSYQGVNRLSGFYGDPNLYSAHISAALGGIMVLVLKEKDTRRRIALLASLVVLVYCGLLSVSKSFFIISFVLIFLWITEALLMRGKISFKIALIFVVLLCGVFVLSSTVFSDLIDAVTERFRNSGSAAALTTGRTELWGVYIKAIINDPWNLLFGKGYSNALEGEKISHNTLIQIAYQFGLTGIPFLIMWEWQLFKRFLGGIRLRYGMLMRVVIIVIGTIGPWLALDLLFFDEFFLMQFYLMLGIKHIYNKDISEEKELLGSRT